MEKQYWLQLQQQKQEIWWGMSGIIALVISTLLKEKPAKIVRHLPRFDAPFIDGAGTMLVCFISQTVQFSGKSAEFRFFKDQRVLCETKHIRKWWKCASKSPQGSRKRLKTALKQCIFEKINIPLAAVCQTSLYADTEPRYFMQILIGAGIQGCQISFFGLMAFWISRLCTRRCKARNWQYHT